MLTDQGLRHPDGVHEFVDAVPMIGQQIDDREADGSGQRTEEAARRVVLLKFWVRDRERVTRASPLPSGRLPCTYAP